MMVTFSAGIIWHNCTDFKWSNSYLDQLTI